MSITEADGKIVYVNEKFCELTGYPQASLIHATHRLLKSNWHDRDFYDQLWQTISKGQTWQGEVCNRRQNGELYWVKATIYPFADETPQGRHYIALHTDITALKNALTAQAYQQPVLDAMPDSIAIADASNPDLPLIYANRAFESLTGYKLSEILGKNCRFLQQDDKNQAALDEIRLAISEKRGCKNLLLRNYRKDGTLFWNELTITPVYDASHTITHLVGIQKDVTQRLQMEQELSAERHFTETAINAIPALFFVLDHDGRLQKCNQRLAETTGYDCIQLLDMRIWDLLQKTDQEKVAGCIRETLERGYAAIETSLQKKNGENISFYFQFVSFVSTGEKRLIATGTDLTEYRQTLKRMEITEERLRRSQRYANIATWEWDIQTGEVFWSDLMCTLLGLPVGSLQPSVESFIATVHPDDRQGLRESISTAVKTSAKYDIECRCIWPDGSIHWLSHRGAVERDEQGRAIRMLGVSQDFTDLRRAQSAERHANELAQSTIDSLRANICVLDDQGKIITVNRSWREHAILSGFNPTVSWENVNYLAVCDATVGSHREDAQRIARGVRAVLSGALNTYETEYILPESLQGEHFLVRITPLDDKDSGRRYAVLSHQDITQRKRVEIAMKEAKEEAERANQAKSEFLSRMSHELRTPMNAILGFAQLLEYDPTLGEEQRDSLEEILKAGRHLLELINEILDLAKVEAGRVELALEPVPCPDLVDECMMLVQPLAEKQGVRLQMEAFTECAVLADRMRLKQVLINLLSNAIKYNRQNGWVLVQPALAKSARHVRLQVVDNGIGLPSQRIDEIFEPFNRLGAESSNVEGTGIGLVISKRLIEMMGGEIGLSSQPGKGSTFWIELPIAEIVKDGEEIVDEDGELAWENADKGVGSSLVLHIEDNPSNLKLIAHVLTLRPEIHLLQAPTPGLGLELATIHRPDLILLDINMPGLDGYRVLAELRADPKTAEIPVIAVTANATTRDIERGMAAGFDEYLTKPVNVTRLLDTIDRFLAKSSAADAVTGVFRP